MKTVRLYTGGHKLHNNDFEYLRDGNLAVLNAIIKGLTTGTSYTAFPVTDIDFTTSGPFGRKWTEGIVWYNNDFYLLPEKQDVFVQYDDVSFDLAEIPDAENPVIYRDGNSRDVHVTKTLVLRSDTGGVLQGDFLNLNRNIRFVLRDMLIDEAQLIQKLGVSDLSPLPPALITGGLMEEISGANLNGWTVRRGWSNLSLDPNWTSIEQPQYRVLDGDATGNTSGKLVQLRGKIQTSDSATSPITNYIIFPTMPSAIEPDTEKRILLHRSGSGLLKDRLLELLVPPTTVPFGLRNFQPDGTTQQVNLDGVEWWIR